MLVSKGKGKVVFKKDWSTKYMSSNFDSLASYKLMMSVAATNGQNLVLYEVSNRCFDRIKERAKTPIPVTF